MKQNVGKAMTACGAIDPEKLGATLPHEHTLVDLTYYARPSPDPEKAAEFDKPLSLDNLSVALSDYYCIKDNLDIKDSTFIITTESTPYDWQYNIRNERH